MQIKSLLFYGFWHGMAYCVFGSKRKPTNDCNTFDCKYQVSNGGLKMRREGGGRVVDGGESA